ncbi:MAG: carbohydrate ABC transporter permease [Lachnospiraceae bacterium]
MNRIKNRSIARQKTVQGILSYTILFFGVCLVILPILWMVITAVKDDTEIYQMNGSILPLAPTATSFIRIWQDYDFLRYFGNSLLVTFVAVLIALIASALTGYGATRFYFKGKGAFLSFILMTQMFPSIMLLVPYYKILSIYGLGNSLIGLCVVYISFTIPFCSWMMVGYYRTIPIDLDEQAAIDGANHVQTFLKITLPLVRPGLVSSAIYAFITCWNEYMFAAILLTDDKLKTAAVAIAEMNGYYRIAWNDMMAASLVASVPLIIAFIFMQKSFISGLTAGAVK